MGIEQSKRRSTFEAGEWIRMADGQLWAFVLAPTGKDWKNESSADEVNGLIKAIEEADSPHELEMAELAFAIYLLRRNYELAPIDYEKLLSFRPDSSESRNWHRSFQQVVQGYLHDVSNETEANRVSELNIFRTGNFYRLTVKFWTSLLSRL